MKTKRIIAAVTFETDWERQILAGLTAYAHEQDLHWEIRAVSRSTDLSHLIKNFNPDGILCHPNMPLPDKLPSVIRQVWFDWGDLRKLPRAGVNDRAIGRMAAEYFLSRNFSRFCYVGNLDRPYGKLRRDGFHQRLKTAGFSCTAFNTKGYFIGLLNSRESPELQNEFIRCLESQDKPLALFSSDDFTAYTVLELCRKTGLDVPNEVSLLSSNNDELVCHACDPRLSSIRVPYRQVGRQAAEWLHQLLEKKGITKKTASFDPLEVVERGSTAVWRIDDPLVAESLKYIEESFRKRIGIPELLQLTGLSRSMLERRFKQAINRTPGFEIQHRRIEYAKQLLRDTDQPVHKIAATCGYSSSNRFCQAFRDKVSLSPNQYRSA